MAPRLVSMSNRPENDPALEDVVARERDFHDRRFATTSDRRTAKYYAVESGVDSYRHRLEAEVAAGCRVLEYGCGTGSAAFDLARSGADVTAIDVSAVAIAEAPAEARRRGVGVRFLTMDAHRLEFGDDAFDVVCGSGILHHLDLATALPEVARVMRPGGVALFYEPLGTNPAINLYRRLTPSIRTPDEHPLVPSDLRLAKRWFGEVESDYHTFLALAGAVLARLGPARRLTPVLVRLDRWLFDRIPVTRRLAWVIVLRLSRPHTSTSVT